MSGIKGKSGGHTNYSRGEYVSPTREPVVPEVNASHVERMGWLGTDECEWARLALARLMKERPHLRRLLEGKYGEEWCRRLYKEAYE